MAGDVRHGWGEQAADGLAAARADAPVARSTRDGTRAPLAATMGRRRRTPADRARSQVSSRPVEGRLRRAVVDLALVTAAGLRADESVARASAGSARARRAMRRLVGADHRDLASRSSIQTATIERLARTAARSASRVALLVERQPVFGCFASRRSQRRARQPAAGGSRRALDRQGPRRRATSFMLCLGEPPRGERSTAPHRVAQVRAAVAGEPPGVARTRNPRGRRRAPRPSPPSGRHDRVRARQAGRTPGHAGGGAFGVRRRPCCEARGRSPRSGALDLAQALELRRASRRSTMRGPET